MAKKIMIFLLFFLSLIISCKKTAGKLPENLFVSAVNGSVLRSNPDINSNAITTLPYMTKVQVLKENDELIYLSERFGKWVNVKSDNNEGWIFSGFLCVFKPDSIIHVAAEFYRTEYRKDKWFSKYDEYTKFKDSEVKVVNVIDNYITLEIPITSRTDIEISRGNVIWKYDPATNQFSEVFNVRHANSTTLIYLDTDQFPDLIVEDGCCSSPDVHIFLGFEKGFNNIYEMKDDCNSDEFYELKPGNCDKMTFNCSKIERKTVSVRVKSTDVPINEETEYLRHFRFNCGKSRIEQSGEGLISSAGGLITALDINNKTISIDDDTDHRIRTFMLSDDVFVSGKKAEKLTDLKIGEDVGISYETIDGKDIVLRIDSQEGWGPSSFKEKGLVIAVDSETKKLAIKVSGYNHIYDLADYVEFKTLDKRTIDQLEPNEEVEIVFEKGNINRITTSGDIYISGSILSIDKEKRMITIKTDEGDNREYQFADWATIKIQNKKASISDIKEGSKFRAYYFNLSKRIISINIW